VPVITVKTKSFGNPHTMQRVISGSSSSLHQLAEVLIKSASARIGLTSKSRTIYKNKIRDII